MVFAPNHPMPIRTATVIDVPSIAHIHVKSWSAAYRGQMPDAVLDALNAEHLAVLWQEQLAQERRQVFVAEKGGSIVGFSDVIPSRDEGAPLGRVAEIAAIDVLPEHWRKGVGGALCHGALTNAFKRGYRVVTTWVLDSNVAARHFFGAMGFELDEAAKTVKATDGSPLHEIRFRQAL
jgi:GNAT superfamily N-acetyltransferase